MRPEHPWQACLRGRGPALRVSRYTPVIWTASRMSMTPTPTSHTKPMGTLQS
ncbi:MAG TPA: hypothetical protein PL151_18480 [Phycisphaerae bacterium]|nr:hypothetical protein [Phycisphaerae bacterium]HOJ75258.1 hypothetical protein [Phycisphaerae bacterium]HOM52403.1 hypothetical protein [Phycisphaerae bacterium]HON67833.1 hypothetical protein [Phycisphaerae bacterium]HOQ85799.1 hypothetical protein [Phycisphaerae bacterium]